MAVVDTPATPWIYIRAQSIPRCMVLAKTIAVNVWHGRKALCRVRSFDDSLCIMTHEAGENPSRASQTALMDWHFFVSTAATLKHAKLSVPHHPFTPRRNSWTRPWLLRRRAYQAFGRNGIEGVLECIAPTA